MKAPSVPAMPAERLAADATSRVRGVVSDLGSVDAALETRMSVRAFLPQPPPRETIADILRLASRAPSGTNTQPWKVYVVQGESRERLIAKVCAVHDALRADPALAAGYAEEYDYYPRQWVSPYLERRRENGRGFYGLLGIGRGDKNRMHAQLQRNFRLFDAPVGLMFTIDRILGRGSFIDYGMFLQSVMVAARARGLHTCPQAAWNAFSRIVMPHIGAPDSEMLVCCIALGYADESDPVNTFDTPRLPVDAFTRWLG